MDCRAAVGGRREGFQLAGTDKALLGQTAANIRALRPPEPYKGKGVKFLEEQRRVAPERWLKSVLAHQRRRERPTLLVFLASCAATPKSQPTTAAVAGAAPAGDGYKLVWSDEFNTDGPLNPA